MDPLKVDNSFLSAHPTLARFLQDLRLLADIIDQERTVVASAGEKCLWYGADNFANFNIRQKNILALYGDDVLNVLSPEGGKRVDIILGVIKNVATKNILAIECKFKVGAATCARLDFYTGIEDKHTHVRQVIGEQPIPFYEKWVILMCRGNAAICRNNLCRFRNQFKGLRTFSCIECINVEELEHALT